MSDTTLQALAVVCELTGATWSKAALQIAERELDAYPQHDVLAALDSCARELSGRLSLAAILERVQERDGRPSPEQAWALSIKAMDEQDSVCWNNEIAEAWGTAHRTWATGNHVGARIAFLVEYQRIVKQSREQHVKARWFLSLGHDVTRRAEAVREGLAQGLLAPEFSLMLDATQPLAELPALLKLPKVRP